MAIDRSKRLYLLSDIRVYERGATNGDATTEQLWEHKWFWWRANAIGLRFGSLLAVEGFKVPGFHSLYLTPTTGGLLLDPSFEPKFSWWFRKVLVPVDLAAWTTACSDHDDLLANQLIVDWIERGVLAAAHEYSRDPAPVHRVAANIREKGERALVPIASKKNRLGSVRVDLLAADDFKKSRLIVTVSVASEGALKRQAELKLHLACDAFLICRGIGFDGQQVELKRTNSVATEVAAKGYPSRISVAQMMIVDPNEVE